MLKDKLIPQLYQYIEKNKHQILGNYNKSFEIKFLAQGEYNINYLIISDKNVVLRINTESQLQIKDQIGYEYYALSFLSKSKVTPNVHYLDNTKKIIPYGLLVMDFLEGRHLNYKNDLKRAARIFSKIHSLKIPKNHKFIIEENPMSERIKEAKYLLKKPLASKHLTKEQKSFFKEFLYLSKKNIYLQEYLKLNPISSINNTEVNSSNFIIGKKDYLIDWEKPVISDPTQDITQFLATTTTLWKTDIKLNYNEKEIFYKEYIGLTGPISKDIREKVKIYTPYLYLRALSWCARAFTEYKSENRKIINKDTEEKLNLYMSENFRYKLIKELDNIWWF